MELNLTKEYHGTNLNAIIENWTSSWYMSDRFVWDWQAVWWSDSNKAWCGKKIADRM